MTKWVALSAGVLILLYLTLSMAPEGPPPGAPHTSEGATAACQQEVGDRMASSAFPVSPTVEYREGTGYVIRGVVDETTEGATTRLNYDCIVKYDESGSSGYGVDSVAVWQSH